LDRFAFAFSALVQPSAQAFGKALWGNPETYFNGAGFQWQRVVKLGGICEVPHAELIQPIQWTIPPLAADH
jgi:hypothetical protein